MSDLEFDPNGECSDGAELTYEEYSAFSFWKKMEVKSDYVQGMLSHILATRTPETAHLMPVERALDNAFNTLWTGVFPNGLGEEAQD